MRLAEEVAILPNQPIKVDGGLSQNDFLCQFIADLLDKPLDRCICCVCMITESATTKSNSVDRKVLAEQRPQASSILLGYQLECGQI